LNELRNFDLPLDFTISKTGIIHALGCWFDAYFYGSDNVITLSTGPAAPGTHWYQCRLLFKEPLAVNASQRVVGNIHFDANNSLSYDISITLNLYGTQIFTKQNIRLDDQMYQYLQTPPTNIDSNTSPQNAGNASYLQVQHADPNTEPSYYQH